eukprot:6209154-Pleurochrysis_carterae.AAC.4
MYAFCSTIQDGLYLLISTYYGQNCYLVVDSPRRYIGANILFSVMSAVAVSLVGKAYSALDPITQEVFITTCDLHDLLLSPAHAGDSDAVVPAGSQRQLWAIVVSVFVGLILSIVLGFVLGFLLFGIIGLPIRLLLKRVRPLPRYRIAYCVDFARSPKCVSPKLILLRS